MLSIKGRFLHQENNKIGFSSDFSTIFNEFLKLQLKPKNTFTSRTLEKLFVITQQPLVYGKHPREIEGDVIGSPGAGEPRRRRLASRPWMGRVKSILAP
jgi:hypothetical protein